MIVPQVITTRDEYEAAQPEMTPQQRELWDAEFPKRNAHFMRNLEEINNLYGKQGGQDAK